MGLKKKYINHIIIFILIFTSRESLLFGTSTDVILISIGYVAPLLALSLLLLKKDIDKISNNSDYLVIMLTLITMTMLTNFDMNIKYGYEMLLVFISFFLTRKMLFQDFAKTYCEIMMILTCFAVVTGIVFMLSPNAFLSFPVIFNKGGFSYHNLGLSVIPFSVYGDYYRLYSIFREPGVAMIFINLALLFELFILAKKRKIIVGIFLAGIILTFSTAGYIVTLMILCAYVLSSNFKSSHRFIGIFFVVLFVIAVISNEFVRNFVFGKFSNEDSTSTAARLGSFSNNINLLIEKPHGLIFGLGFQLVEDAFVSIGDQFQGQGHNTNTLLKELAVHGFFFFCLILLRFYYFFKTWFHEKSSVILLLFMSIMAAFCNEDLTANVIIYILIFYSSKFHNKWHQFNPSIK